MTLRVTTAAKMAFDLRRGVLDPVALVEQVFDRLSEIADPAIFIETTRPRAEAEAYAARSRLRSGNPASLLDGVPVAWKDLFDLKGRVTTAGSIVLKSSPAASEDAELVAAGMRAGLLTVGSLNMTEFAYSGIGLNPHYGTPRNPNGTGSACAPGGSSSASGVVVAQDIVPIAFGSDTGGSIRIPAAFNGIVGYKTSTGHYPMQGVFPLSHTLDTIGPLAHSVEDCVLTDTVLRGLRRPVVTGTEISALDFVIPDAVMFDDLASAVSANFESAAARLSKAGARVRRISLPQLEQVQQLITTRAVLAAIEALDLHWGRVHGPDAAQMDARVVRRILNAEHTSAVDLSILMRERIRLIKEVSASLGNAILITPTTATTAMPIGPLEKDEDVFFHHNSLTLRNTAIGNFLDWCGLSIPNGKDKNDMPTGFLLSAPHGCDSKVLSAGLSIENIIRGY
jgi:aspartyl-tRNA(Asn)/glutamyl-tRNA(Gln) amidotransferase subunit A|tara:strand:+ start:20414 stop:21772 length:1359 start_codon:yes stop_codon:yes gene_type:complete